MSLDSSRAFWDAKAAENPYWYVSSYGAYAERDLAEFWQAGRRIWQDLRDTTGYTPRHSDVAIEVGCGIGRLTRAIAADVAHVHAFDISEGMLALARLAGPVNATFHQSHGDSLAGMPSGAADVAVAYCVFQHLPSLAVLARYVTEMRRVVKPGGTLAFAPLHGDKWLFWGRVPDAEPQSAARVAASASRATSRPDRAHAAGLGAS